MNKLSELKASILSQSSVNEQMDDETMKMEFSINNNFICTFPIEGQKMANELEMAITKVYEKFCPEHNLEFKAI